MSAPRKEGSLYTRHSGKLARIEFGHPAGNSFTSELLARLTREIETVGADDKTTVILLQSEGERAFCAGASFDELLQICGPEESTEFFSGFARLINAMRTCPKPIVAGVQGKAVGGGVGLIAACDYALATEGASVRLSELGIGLAPLVIAPAVARKIGPAGLAELSLSPSEWKSAYWALEKGLFSRVFETRREMESEAESLASKLASYPAMALTALKKAFWEGTEHWSELLPQRAAETGRLALSNTTQEALKRFKEKR